MSTNYGAVENALPALSTLLGERLSTAPAVREHHGHDESGFQTVPPDAVAFAHSTEEVSEIMQICARHKVPVIAYGTGTAIEGHVQALRGGVCIDLSQMDRILQVNQADKGCAGRSAVTPCHLA